jgi:hypothetical protein
MDLPIQIPLLRVQYLCLSLNKNNIGWLGSLFESEKPTQWWYYAVIVLSLWRLIGLPGWIVLLQVVTAH